MTTYIYKNRLISHTNFISILRSACINGGDELTNLETLNKEAEKGNARAVEIRKNLKVIEGGDKTYNVVFNDETDSNDKGFKSAFETCYDYIQSNNGTDDSYFADYKGGTVSIVCNETGEEVYSEVVR